MAEKKRKFEETPREAQTTNKLLSLATSSLTPRNVHIPHMYTCIYVYGPDFY